ncbi:hypothetical protein EV182_007306, partial [Spiromyces aspiralis]
MPEAPHTPSPALRPFPPSSSPNSPPTTPSRHDQTPKIHRKNWCRLCRICLTCTNNRRRTFSEGGCTCPEQDLGHVSSSTAKKEGRINFRFRRLIPRECAILEKIRQRFKLDSSPVPRDLARANLCPTCQQRLRRAKQNPNRRVYSLPAKDRDDEDPAAANPVCSDGSDEECADVEEIGDDEGDGNSDEEAERTFVCEEDRRGGPLSPNIRPLLLPSTYYYETPTNAGGGYNVGSSSSRTL